MRNGIRRKGIIFGIIVLLISMNILSVASGKQVLPNQTVLDDWLDQENSDWNGAGLGFDGKAVVAQSFIPMYNSLTRVELIVWNEGNPHGNLTVSIREILNDTDLTSITKAVEELPQKFTPNEVIWTEFDFPDINVTAESTYYIVWSLDIEENPGPTPFNVTCWGTTQNDNYTSGEQWYGVDNYWHSVNPGWDFCFKTYGHEDFTAFVLFFGILIADAKITDVEKDNGTFFLYNYYSDDVEKVTVIGFGSYLHENDSKIHTRLYMKTFTNVSVLGGATYRKFEVSDEYQQFTLLVTFRYINVLLFK